MLFEVDNWAKGTVMYFKGGRFLFFALFAYNFSHFVAYSPELWVKKASHKEAFYRYRLEKPYQ